MSDPWADSHETAGFLCRHCNTHTEGRVLAKHFISEGDGRGPDYRYRLAVCSKCSDASLLISMDVFGNYDDEVAVFPPQPKYLDAVVPETLRQCMEEARACLAVKANTAAVIMYRRSLELLAAERGVKVRNLATALKELKDNGHIDQRLYGWADELRLAGNDAAHEVHTGVSPVDAKDTSDLTEAIIDYVYVFQARYEAFKARRDGS